MARTFQKNIGACVVTGLFVSGATILGIKIAPEMIYFHELCQGGYTDFPKPSDSSFAINPETVLYCPEDSRAFHEAGEQEIARLNARAKEEPAFRVKLYQDIEDHDAKVEKHNKEQKLVYGFPFGAASVVLSMLGWWGCSLKWGSSLPEAEEGEIALDSDDEYDVELAADQASEGSPATIFQSSRGCRPPEPSGPRVVTSAHV